MIPSATVTLRTKFVGCVLKQIPTTRQAESWKAIVAMNDWMLRSTNSATMNYELCSFHVRQWVRVGAEEPISVNVKWASDTFAYRKPSQKPFGYIFGIHRFNPVSLTSFQKTRITLWPLHSANQSPCIVPDWAVYLMNESLVRNTATQWRPCFFHHISANTKITERLPPAASTR